MIATCLSAALHVRSLLVVCLFARYTTAKSDVDAGAGCDQAELTAEEGAAVGVADVAAIASVVATWVRTRGRMMRYHSNPMMFYT